MATGEWVHHEPVDLTLKSRCMDLELARNYRSQREAAGSFGYGWSWNHAEHLEFPGDMVIHFVTPDGTIPVYPDVAYTSAYASVCLDSATWERGESATGLPDATTGYDHVAHYYGQIASLAPLVAGGWNLQAPAGISRILQVDLTSIGATAYDQDHPQYGVALKLSAGGSNAVVWGHRAYDYDYINITSDRSSWTWDDVNAVQARLELGSFVQNADMDIVVDTFHLGVTYTTATDGQYKYLPGSNFELLRTNDEYWINFSNLSRLVFSRDGRLLRKRDPNGNELECCYDPAGRLIHLKDGLGQYLTFTYGSGAASTKVVAVMDLVGRRVGFAYDGDDLVAVTNVMGAVTRYAYDKSQDGPALAHNLVRRTDPQGDEVSCAYYTSNSAADRVSAYRDGELSEGKSNEVDYLYLKGTTYSYIPGAGSIQGVVYNASNDISQVFIREGELVFQDTDGFNLAAGHAAARVRASNTSAWEHLESATGVADGLMAHGVLGGGTNWLEAGDWHFAVPGLSNDIMRVAVTMTGMAPQGAVLSAGGLLATNWFATNTASVTLDVTADRARWTWDDISNLTARLARPSGSTNEVEVQVDGFGLEVRYRHFDPGHDALDDFYFYDLQHHVVSSDHAGAIHRFTYDDHGNLTSWTDAEGRVRQYWYDPESNKPIRTRDALGNETRLEYDEKGRLTNTYDPLGRVTSQVYDSFGNVVLKRYPDQTQETYDYGAEGISVLRFRNRRGAVWVRDYDPAGRCIRVTDPCGGRHETVYDPAGNKVRESDESGVVTLYGYDGRGWLTNTVAAPGTPDESSTALWRDGSGRIVQQRDALGGLAVRGFDGYGHLTYEIDALGGLMITEYDERGFAFRKYDQLGASWENSCDDRGNVVEAHDRRGYSSHTAYNRNNEVVSETDRGGTTRVNDYDRNGNICTETVTYAPCKGCGTNDPVTPLVTVCQFDALNRVTNQTVGVNRQDARTISYEYDLGGNVTRTTDSAGVTRIDARDANGNVTNSLLTDANGHMIQCLSARYDDMDRKVMEIQGFGGAVATNRMEYDLRGLKVADIDALGRVTRFTYDRQRRLVSLVRPDGSEYQAAYDRCGRRTLERESGGAVTRFVYDAAGRIMESVVGEGLPDARTTRYTYDAVGRVVREVDPLGGVTSRCFDDEGNCISETNALGSVVTRQFDAMGRVVQTQNELGYTTSQHWNGIGKLCRAVDPLGREVHFSYDVYGQLVRRVDPLGSVESWGYDSLGRSRLETNALGLVTASDYDAVGRVTNRVEGVGLPGRKQSRFVYDELGRELSRCYPDGSVWNKEFDAAGNQLRITDPRGYVTRYTYDPGNRPIVVSNALGGITRRDYDLRGNEISSIDALGGRIRAVFDEYNLKRRQIDPLGGVTRYEYDKMGHLTRLTDAMGASESWHYDACGRVVQAVAKNGASTDTAYDQAGRVIRITDALGATCRKHYDAAGNILAETDKRGQSTSWRYDALNRPVAILDALSNAVVLAYDAAGHKIRECFPSGRVITYGWDRFGRLVSKQDGAGSRKARMTRYDYDRMDRLISERDPLGRAMLVEYDQAGNRTAVTDRRGHVTRMEYDALNRLRATVDAMGGRSSVEYDALGRIVASVNRNGAVTRHGYDACGRLTMLCDGVGNRSRKRYDIMGRCAEEVAANGLVTRNSYDAAGQLTNQVQDAGGGVRRSHRWVYDALGRQTALWDASGSATINGYDANGNVVTVSMFNAAGTLLRSKQTEYDGRNLPVRYRDFSGQLWQTDYNAMGLKLVDTDPLGNRTQYEYDGFDQPSGKIDPSGAHSTFLYDRMGRVSEALDAAGQRTRYEYDPNGNQTACIDDSGYAVVTTYDPLNRPVEVNTSLPDTPLDCLSSADVNGDGRVDKDDLAALEEGLP